MTASGETNDGSATNTEHDTDTSTENGSYTSPTFNSSQKSTGGDLDDSFVSGTYDTGAGGETDSDIFDLEDRPSGTLDTKTSTTTPGDAGTNSSTSYDSSFSSDDADDDGTVEKSGGQVTNETDPAARHSSTSDFAGLETHARL